MHLSQLGNEKLRNARLNSRPECYLPPRISKIIKHFSSGSSLNHLSLQNFFLYYKLQATTRSFWKEGASSFCIIEEEEKNWKFNALERKRWLMKLCLCILTEDKYSMAYQFLPPAIYGSFIENSSLFETILKTYYEAFYCFWTSPSSKQWAVL